MVSAETMSAIQFVNKHSHVTRLFASTQYGGRFPVESQQVYIRGTGSPHSSYIILLYGLYAYQ